MPLTLTFCAADLSYYVPLTLALSTHRCGYPRESAKNRATKSSLEPRRTEAAAQGVAATAAEKGTATAIGIGTETGTGSESESEADDAPAAGMSPSLEPPAAGICHLL